MENKQTKINGIIQFCVKNRLVSVNQFCSIPEGFKIGYWEICLLDEDECEIYIVHTYGNTATWTEAISLETVIRKLPKYYADKISKEVR